jgi:hypothetical protein
MFKRICWNYNIKRVAVCNCAIADSATYVVAVEPPYLRHSLKAIPSHQRVALRANPDLGYEFPQLDTTSLQR